MTKQQQTVLNTASAMNIIIEEAKKTVANKFNTNIKTVELAITLKQENVISMMSDLIAEGINQVAELV